MPKKDAIRLEAIATGNKKLLALGVGLQSAGPLPLLVGPLGLPQKVPMLMASGFDWIW